MGVFHLKNNKKNSLHTLYIISFCFSPVSKTASYSVCTGDPRRGDGKHRLPEVQLWKQLQQLAGIRGSLVSPLTRGQKGGAQTGDHHPDLRLDRAGRIQPPSRGQGLMMQMPPC